MFVVLLTLSLLCFWFFVKALCCHGRSTKEVTHADQEGAQKELRRGMLEIRYFHLRILSRSVVPMRYIDNLTELGVDQADGR